MIAYVWNGVHLHTGAGVALKFEVINPSVPSTLPYEAAVYAQLEGVEGIPRIHWFGQDKNANVLVMDKLGLNLKHLRHFCRGQFGLKTISMLGEQMVSPSLKRRSTLTTYPALWRSFRQLNTSMPEVSLCVTSNLRTSLWGIRKITSGSFSLTWVCPSFISIQALENICPSVKGVEGLGRHDTLAVTSTSVYVCMLPSRPPIFYFH